LDRPGGRPVDGGAVAEAEERAVRPARRRHRERPRHRSALPPRVGEDGVGRREQDEAAERHRSGPAHAEAQPGLQLDCSAA